MATPCMFSTIFVLCTFGLVLGFAPRQQLGNPHIVGGEDVKIQDVPYHASVRRFLNYYCGASIIGKYYALSAAHCFHNRYWLIWYGINAGSDLVKQGNYHVIRSVVSHESYVYDSSDYDICVVRLWFGFNFDERVKPIAIVDPGEKVAVGSKLLVTGWGRETEFAATIPDKLKKTVVEMIDEEKCKLFYTDRTYTDRMFCAGLENGTKDACNGDSGGPIVDMATGKQVGIVSWGVGCGAAERPGVYTKLSHTNIAGFIAKNIH